MPGTSYTLFSYTLTPNNEFLYADYCFGDPKYTMSLSRHFTISTALDALAHSYESYFSKKANDMSKALSLQAIKLLWESLKYLKNRCALLSLNQRRELYNASILAGLAINMTGCVFPHNVGYYFTEEFGLPHGVACALFSDDLFKHERKIDSDNVDKFFIDLGVNEKEFLELIRDLLPEINIRLTEEEINKILPRWKGNKTVDNTLGDISLDDIKEILIHKFVY